MEQKDVEQAAKFKIGDKVNLPAHGLKTPVTWTVIRRYWNGGPTIVYDLEGTDITHKGAREGRLTKADEQPLA